MFTCKICGKKFKAATELGGHMSSAHGRNRVEDAETQNAEPDAGAVQSVPEEPQGELPEEEQPDNSNVDPGVMDSIRDLMRQGYTPKQVKERFGYARRTVDQVAAEFIEPEGKTETDDITHILTQPAQPERLPHRGQGSAGEPRESGPGTCRRDS